MDAQTLLQFPQAQQEQQDSIMSNAVIASCIAIQSTESREGDTCIEGRAFGSRNVKRSESTWIKQYLSNSATYDKTAFRRRFHMPLTLFWRIHHALFQSHPAWLSTRTDSAGRRGTRSKIKILVALRRLATGRSCDDIDESAGIGEESIRMACKRFCEAMVETFGHHYLNRRTDAAELSRIEE